MSKNNRNFIDDMVDMFGYDYVIGSVHYLKFGNDYVIGFCLCSEYDLRNKANNETDYEKAKRLRNIARSYKLNAERLTRERIDNGL